MHSWMAAGPRITPRLGLLLSNAQEQSPSPAARSRAHGLGAPREREPRVRTQSPSSWQPQFPHSRLWG